MCDIKIDFPKSGHILWFLSYMVGLYCTDHEGLTKNVTVSVKTWLVAQL